MRVTGPDTLIAAVGLPLRAKIGELTQRAPTSDSSSSNAYPVCSMRASCLRKRSGHRVALIGWRKSQQRLSERRAVQWSAHACRRDQARSLRALDNVEI